MSVYEIQFQKGLSLPDFIREFGTRSKCEKYLFRRKWPTGFKCPKCGGDDAVSFNKGKHTVFQCRHCHAQTSLLVGTLFQGTHIPLTKWFLAIYLISEAKTSIASLDLHRKLGINHKSAWLMMQKIMQAMVNEEKTSRIRGRIEMDDAYLGGKLKGGKPGRGSENKQPFIAAVQTNADKKPLYAKIDPVETFNAAEVEKWIHAHVTEGSLIVSDGLDCFRAVEKDYEHETHIAARMTEEEKELHFKWVNIILANLKTSLTGTFHSIECHKYASRYFGAFVYRFNRRWCLTQIPYSLADTVINSPPITAEMLRC